MELNLIKRDGPVKGNSHHNAPLMVKINVAGRRYDSMCDTGASDCFVDKKVRDEMGEDDIWETEEKNSRRVSFGDKSSATILETVRIRCTIGGAVVHYDFHVVEGLAYSLILGRNFLADAHAEILPAEGKIKLFTKNPVSPIQNTQLLPWEERIIQVGPWGKLEGPDKEKEAVIIEPSHLSMAAVSQALNKNGASWFLRVGNFSEYPIFLGKVI